MPYIFLLLICIFTTSCGLRPLSDFEKNDSLLTFISIGKISGHDSYLTENYLSNALNIYNTDTKKSYVIDVNIVLSKSNAIIQKDSRIVEQTMILASTYVLKDIKTLKELDRKTIVTRSNFSNTNSPYGSFIQEQKSYKETLKISVNDITKHLLLFFAKERPVHK